MIPPRPANTPDARSLPRRPTLRQSGIEIGDVVLADFVWSTKPVDDQKNRPCLVVNAVGDKGLLVVTPISSSPAARQGPKDTWRALSPGEKRAMGLDQDKQSTLVLSETNIVEIAPETPSLRMKSGSWTVGRAAPPFVNSVKTARRALNEEQRLAPTGRLRTISREELDRHRTAGAPAIADAATLSSARKPSAPKPSAPKPQSMAAAQTIRSASARPAHRPPSGGPDRAR